MALTRVETQVTWAAANSAGVTANGSQTSDVITLDATCVAARILLKAQSPGTPTAADTIYFSALESMGDPDGAAADEFVTPGNGLLLGAVDTFVEDPGLRAAELPLPQKSFKLYADGSVTTTVQTLTVSATITELRSS